MYVFIRAFTIDKNKNPFIIRATFVSQCEKKSLNKTRRVLDAFANRIGNRNEPSKP